jgi:hypothetical protein
MKPMAPKVKNFPFESLKSYNRTQFLLVNALACVFDTSFRSQLIFGINEKIKKWIPVGLKFKGVEVGSISDPAEYDALESFVGLEFFEKKSNKPIFVFVESTLLVEVAHYLLGGSKSKEVKVTPLLRGVFEFVLLALVEAFNEQEHSFKIGFQGLIDGIQDVVLRTQADQSVLITGLVELDKRDFAYRLVFSGNEIFRDADLMRNQMPTEESLKKFDHLRTLLWAQIGHVILSESELKEIRKGDVILLDDAWPEYSESGLSGHIKIGMGSGEGKFEGRIMNADPLRIQIDKLVITES